MSNFSKIKSVTACEIIDSRGNPTVEATVELVDGSKGTASVPSGASTGRYEALELRDKDHGRYMGRGVLSAVANVNTIIAESLEGSRSSQYMVDRKMLALDATDNKSNLGANAMLAVSLAVAKAAARHYTMPLFRYLGGANAVRLPFPMMNILNGGAHASNNIDIQEFMIMPIGFESFREALRAGCEVYHALGKLLKSEGKSVAVGDEGGFAPDLSSDSETLEYICRAIELAGYDTDRIKIALDAAASEWQTGEGEYTLPKSQKSFTSEGLVDYFEKLISNYPIVSIEDPLGEDDHDGWSHMTSKIGSRCTLVGDDLFVTNAQRLGEGIKNGEGNAILIKPNQIGTLSETLGVMRLAAENGYRTIVSHRSGETPDTYIADIAVAMNAGFIKTGAPCRGERVAKYNRLLKIESMLGTSARYGEF